MATFTTTTKWALRWLTGSNVISDIDAGFQALAEDVDSKTAGYAEGTFAGKPAAGKAGRIYRCTDTGQWLADTGSAWVDLNAAPALVTSLPSSPYDGQEIFYSADPTNGVVWHLRYRAASASTYKWEIVGPGSALIAEDYTNLARSDSTWVDGGPSITVPLAGEYEMFLSSQVSLNPSAGAWMGLAIGASADGGLGLAWTMSTTSASPPSLFASLVSTTMVKTVAAAATVVKMRVRGSNANTVTFANWGRSLSIRPRRVG